MNDRYAGLFATLRSHKIGRLTLMRSGAVFAALTLMAHVPGHSWPMLQAVGDESATVNENGSGGTHYRAVLNGYPGVFNLAASRVIKYKTAGQQSVSFKKNHSLGKFGPTGKGQSAFVDDNLGTCSKRKRS
jgi:hypothetical protein